MLRSPSEMHRPLAEMNTEKRSKLSNHRKQQSITEQFSNSTSSIRRSNRRKIKSLDLSHSINIDEDINYISDDESIDMNSNRKILKSMIESPSSSYIEKDIQSISMLSHYQNVDEMNTSDKSFSDHHVDENAMFEGFCIDVLQLIAKMVGFQYSIKLVPDGKYGVYDLETGEWNGIVRELMDKVSFLSMRNDITAMQTKHDIY